MSELQPLLERTSRTFALSVPLLPEPLREEVTVAYLLLRIADTLEDEAPWPAVERIAALARLSDAIRARTDAAGRTRPSAHVVFEDAGIRHEGYAELLRETARVLAAFEGLEAASRATIARHVLRTIEGMSAFLARSRPLATLGELRAYCYAVAGIVGELCTALFVARSASLSPHAAQLTRLAAAFGEGLQLVNVLKDEAVDAGSGRCYVPAGLERAALHSLAADDLHRASTYVGLLEQHGAQPGVIAFNTFNLLLAFATLPQVRARGPGAKITHEQVRDAQARILAATGTGASVLPLLRRAAAALQPAGGSARATTGTRLRRFAIPLRST